MNIAIIGGGAAGCFAAINLKRRLPEAAVTVYESGKTPLAKVAVTGGGRCNLTNSFRDVKSIEAVYPRGGRLMKRLLREFSSGDACRWFEEAGVKLTVQPDQCVFPVSQDAMEVVNTLLREMRREGVSVRTHHRVCRICAAARTGESGGNAAEKSAAGRGFVVQFSDNSLPERVHDMVIVATGGSPKRSGLDFLNGLGHDIVPPVPSLFSFCLPDSGLTNLMGTVVDEASVGLCGTKLRASGPLLITHWGLSGPAVLKLSSYAARILQENGYKARISVNWFGGRNEQEVAGLMAGLAARNPQKQLSSVYPEAFNARLWTYLLGRSGLKTGQRWAELGTKSCNRLAAILTNDCYEVTGKNRFKDEFVTCGGVALGGIDARTLESKAVPGLYFAGEVTDVDAVTGGFNLQAAWSMAHVVAAAVAAKQGRGGED